MMMMIMIMITSITMITTTMLMIIMTPILTGNVVAMHILGSGARGRSEENVNAENKP